MSGKPRTLYLITPPRIDDVAGFASMLNNVLDVADVAALQIRLKADDGGAAPDDVVRTVADAVIPIAQTGGVAAILNDRPDLAAELGADGVHVGQSDASYDEARAAMGPNGVVGVTCHNSRNLAMEAAEAGADYVAFGAFFTSTTKSPKTTANPDILEWWSEVFTVPCVAIGGVNADNCGALLKAGADFVAASSAVWSHGDGPVAGVRALSRALEQASSQA